MKRTWKIFIALLGTGTLILAVALFAFQIHSRRALPNFRPIHSDPPQTIREAEAAIPGYVRPEESTYLTYTEWYLVFNPQEYARFIAHERPSRFPYGRSIELCWSGFADTYGIAHRHYPFNAGNILMLSVISTSFTVEYLVKGIWENTLGWLTEFSSGGEQTEEDLLAARVAYEYGAFIPHDPWFQFPFGAKLHELWHGTSLWGAHPIRKWERKIFLSLEYGIKSIYAGIIQAGSHAVFGVADTEIFVAAKKPRKAIDIPGVRIARTLDSATLVAVPHYQGFTETAPKMAQAGWNFIDVAGNDEILATVLSPKTWKFQGNDAHTLFDTPVFTDRTIKRTAFQVPVRNLGSFLRALDRDSVRVEHLFDF